MRETDNTALQRCALCVDTRAGALSETGDLIMPIREGAIGDLLDLGQTERRLIDLGVHPLVVLRHQADMLASTHGESPIRLLDAASPGPVSAMRDRWFWVDCDQSREDVSQPMKAAKPLSPRAAQAV
ncbi:hypothetical protein [Pseudomonas sp. MMS21 TM103]|uniref:hypothetical protein n=1 Tax=Pseudomonas sp. MMS21 TM103 TaxID=2886506 RepID=UPI003FA727C0